MRLAVLYLRSRGVERALLTLGLVAPVAWALTWLLISVMGYGVDHGALTMLQVFAALAAACVIGASVHSPFGDAERAVARPLSPLRSLQLLGLLFWAALVLSAVMLTFDLDGARPEHPLLVLLRQLAGLVGLALITAWLLGARLSWLPPLILTIAHATALVADGGDIFSSWAWHSQPGTHGPSWAIALTLLAAGLVLVCLLGTREPAGEE